MYSRASRLSASVFVLFLGLPAFSAVPDDRIEEIVVTADYRERAISEFPASVTVLDAKLVEQLAVQHFEELVNVVPNLSWSGDGHRARYFQIRGVGELEQYQGAPNPSVGFLIDDIDFSGIGTVATLFDVQSIDVLRGPQGSRYGANALAGLIYIRSVEPTPERNGRVKLMAADDDAWSAGLAFGGSLTGDDSALYRLSAHHHTSNGYRDNPYLGREDTNGREETALRGRLSLASANDFSANLAFMYTSIDNGYDAFSLDNSYTMLSDKPGKDAQESIGGSLRLEWFTPGFATLTSITTLADSSIDFSFDADWGNDESWAPVTYDYTSVSDRNRQTISQEFRLASGDSDASDWLIGFYSLNLREDLQTVDIGEYYDPGYDFADSLDSRIASDYEATNVAMFGQVEHELTAKTRLGFGLRAERRMTNYDDNQGLTASPSESMWGGDISLSHDLSEALTSYLSLSKGYKAGGFNLGRVPDGQREFGKEELWNLEAGMKAELADSSVFLNASLFANRRDNQQVRISEQLDPGDPTTFVFFTDNVDSGESIGFEADLRWLPNDNWQLYANVGLLSTDIAGGRDQAHAPAYTAAVGGQYRHDNGWYGRVDMTARDAFYFDVSHDQSSEAYELVNLRIGYDANTWSVQLWARNLFDQQYAVRGFYFGNEPPDFPATLYTRQGDPRQVGLTLERRF